MTARQFWSVVAIAVLLGVAIIGLLRGLGVSGGWAEVLGAGLGPALAFAGFAAVKRSKSGSPRADR